MPSYQAPVDDWLLILNHFLRVQDESELPGYSDLTPELCGDIVRSAARFHEEVVYPAGVCGDIHGAKLIDGQVRTPPSYRDAWEAYRSSGWLSLSVPEALGGGGLPAILSAVVGEMRCASAHSLSMYVGFCISAARMLHALGDDWMREHVVPRLVSGDWTATMCLTESHCGTDLRQIRTRAVPHADGSWRISGSKIFISGGDHDLSENIVHIVLAKVADVAGNYPQDLGAVNVFLVSKRDLNPLTGELGAGNGVSVTSIEHKMGIEGNATCVMQFEDAHAWRIADSNGRGTAANMAAMFVLMNYARISTALSGVAYAELAGQNARSYARERLVGRAPTGIKCPERPGDPLISHPDVRRLLIGARAFAEGARATALRAALWQAQAEHLTDICKRTAAQDLMELMTPVMKAYFTDMGFIAANDCLQVLGGHGYIRDYGIEQMVRNARVGQIYEGANGIQAIDLVQRKLPARNWRAASTLVEQLNSCAEMLTKHRVVAEFAAPMMTARHHLASIFETLQQRGEDETECNLAVAYDVLHACGIAVLGWTWASMVAAVIENEAVPELMRRRKLVLARYWMKRELPKLAYLSATVASSSSAILELQDEEI